MQKQDFKELFSVDKPAEITLFEPPLIDCITQTLVNYQSLADGASKNTEKVGNMASFIPIDIPTLNIKKLDIDEQPKASDEPKQSAQAIQPKLSTDEEPKSSTPTSANATISINPQPQNQSSNAVKLEHSQHEDDETQKIITKFKANIKSAPSMIRQFISTVPVDEADGGLPLGTQGNIIHYGTRLESKIIDMIQMYNSYIDQLGIFN